jgi:RNA polymerase sigma-70 factor (ECF subfamily)
MDFLTELEGCMPGLRRYARALLRDSDQADDLVQDCLERAISRRHLWRGGPSLRAWLFRIMHNLYANEIRARRSRPTLEPLDPAHQLPDESAAPLGRVALHEMERALAQLSEEQRQVVLMVSLTGMSYTDCATALNLPLGTVMSRLSRGRERLRQLLDGEPEDSAGQEIRRVK